MGLNVLFVVILFLGTLTGLAIFFWDPFPSPLMAPSVQPGWWGKGDRANYKEDKSIRKFSISIPQKVLKDLKSRLHETLYPEPLEDVNFEYGFNINYLREVVDYWINGYNWTVHETNLNSFDHFKTQIEGLDVHFMHVKPTNVPNHVRVLPIMLIHGWPGSFVEFLGVLPHLTTVRHGRDFVFEVICPSIPGYGFSEASHKKGLGIVETAHIFDELMQRLGFKSYYVQGGDWGSAVATSMGCLFPQRVKGLHVNFVINMTPKYVVKWLIGQYLPWLFQIAAKDYAKMYPIGDVLTFVLRESGYSHIQGTKPDTIGMTLANSPAGLAAYILEKFSTWTDESGIDDAKGKLTKKFTLDQLLTNVMIYWVTGSITTSQRYYKENFSERQRAYQMERVKVDVPTGVASFPRELIVVPRFIAEQTFGDKLVSFTEMPRGGHFAAFEEPQLLADDVWKFAEIVETLQPTAKPHN